MADLWTYNGTTGAGNDFTFSITDDFYFDKTDDYITNPGISYQYQVSSIYGGTEAESAESVIAPTGFLNNRFCFLLGNGFTSDTGAYTISIYGTGTGYILNGYDGINVDYYGQIRLHQYVPYNALAADDFRASAVSPFTFSANAPIFTDATVALNYLRNGYSDSMADYCVNIKESEKEEESDEVLLYSMGVLQTWDNSGLIYENDGAGVAIHKGIRGKLKSGSISLYPITGISDGSLKYGLKMSNNVAWVYLEEVDGFTLTWQEVESVSIDFLYRKRIDELGTFHASRIALDTNTEFNAKIPIFEDETTAQGYIDGNVDITQATNWRTISQNYPITNGTEDGDSETTFGQAYNRSFFSQLYLLGQSALADISNALFTPTTADPTIAGAWEYIKEGIEMYGADPMQAVQGLMYFPVNLTEVFPNTDSRNYVYFGSYQCPVPNGVHRVIFPQGYKDVGTMRIVPSFGGTWRDYEPYTKLYVYIPYCGTYQLDLARYYNKTTTIRYYIDLRTGGCCVCLIADGLLIDIFNGQMGVQMPITLTDKSAYANSQSQILLQGLQGIGGVGGKTYDAVSQAVATAGGAGAGVSGAFGLLQGGIEVAKTVYGLSQNNVSDYNKTKGGSTSQINCYLPQHVTFIFEIQQADETANEVNLQGLPSNASGTIDSFSGYLEVESVNLVCGIATENEKRTIQNALKNGIII